MFSFLRGIFLFVKERKRLIMLLHSFFIGAIALFTIPSLAAPATESSVTTRFSFSNIFARQISEYDPRSDENNSFENVNTLSPRVPIYPSKASGDAPYTISEAQLRAAIKIPTSFQYGKSGKTPVILVHGTGQTGAVNFLTNVGKLLVASDFADIVWLNIPTRLLQDAQRKDFLLHITTT